MEQEVTARIRLAAGTGLIALLGLAGLFGSALAQPGGTIRIGFMRRRIYREVGFDAA